jgi:hypothetical protein
MLGFLFFQPTIVLFLCPSTPEFLHFSFTRDIFATIRRRSFILLFLPLIMESFNFPFIGPGELFYVNFGI